MSALGNGSPRWEAPLARLEATLAEMAVALLARDERIAKVGAAVGRGAP